MALADRRLRGERTSNDDPYGYTHEGKRLVPLAAEQAVLLRIRELRAGGLGIRSIARTLNCEGVPARGRKWYPMTVQRVLAREQALGAEVNARVRSAPIEAIRIVVPLAQRRLDALWELRRTDP